MDTQGEGYAEQHAGPGHVREAPLGGASVEDARAAGFKVGDDIAEALERTERDEPPPTLDELMNQLAEYVERRMESLEPDGDVAPMTSVVGERHEIPILHPVDAADADAAFHGFIPAVMEAVQARCFATLTAAWMLPWGANSDPDDPEFVPPSEHPGRLDCVTIVGSDGVRVVTMTRRVARGDGPPVFAERAWTRVVTGLDGSGGNRIDKMLDSLVYSRWARAARVLTFTRPEEWWTEERFKAAQAVFAAIDEAGDTPQGLRDAARDSLPDLIAAQVILGIFAVDGDGKTSGPSDEVRELALRDDLWDIPVGSPL